MANLIQNPKLPQEIFVYQTGTLDGRPLYAVVASIDEISANCDGEIVGRYNREESKRFRIHRSWGTEVEAPPEPPAETPAEPPPSSEVPEVASPPEVPEKEEPRHKPRHKK